MLRASLHAVHAALLVGGLAAADAAAAADRDTGRPTNTFVLITVAPPAPTANPRPTANSVGVPPAKPVVSNPYHVPLLQNAGSLRAR